MLLLANTAGITEIDRETGLHFKKSHGWKIVVVHEYVSTPTYGGRGGGDSTAFQRQEPLAKDDAIHFSCLLALIMPQVS